MSVGKEEYGSYPRWLLAITDELMSNGQEAEAIRMLDEADAKALGGLAITEPETTAVIINFPNQWISPEQFSLDLGT